MKNQYDFSRSARRNREAGRVARHGRDSEKSVAEDDDAPLTRTQMRELDRLAKDSRDRTRYLLISSFNPRFALYYNVSEDTYGMNEPIHATLFKRRAAALAVKRLLGSGMEIVSGRVDRRGRLVLNSVAVQTRKRRRTRNEVARPRR